MKRALVIYFSFCCTFILKAQEHAYLTVDSRVLDIPKAATNSTGSIASFVQSNFKKDREKFRAIYRWVTYNIKYDTDSMYVFNWGADPEKKVTSALRRRKGVCENYTALFNEISLKCNLQSFVVSGYTKQLNSIDKVGHSWCAVNVDGEWLLCDPTWDEGYRSYAYYFLIEPALFIQSHMPFDPLWQLLDQPLTHEEFYKGVPASKARNATYHFADSVKAFLRLNELQQLEAAAARIRKSGAVNELVKNNLAYIEMLVSIIYEDKDMKLYNSAVEDLNKAAVFFNDFIQYRNKQFIPERPDDEIKALLTPIENKLASAQKKLDDVDRSTFNVQYDTKALRTRLNVFQTRVREQKDFLIQYISTPLPGRKKLFYN